LKTLLLISLFLSPLLVQAQINHEYQLFIAVRSGASPQRFYVEIFREHDKVSVHLKKWFSNSGFLTDEDLDEAKAISSISRERELTMEEYERIDNIYRKYDVYSIDSFIIEGNHPYTTLLDSVFYTSKESLERKFQNKNRFVIHGSSVRFIIKDSTSYRRVYATSPDIESHPLIYRLIADLLKIYRSGSPIILQKKVETMGY
jgi:hypothetical protein